MQLRVSHPGTPTKLVDLGPAAGRVHHDAWAMRQTIEEQLAHHQLARHRARYLAAQVAR